jgi:transitional endoplasmic reticulum ATPase
VLVIGATNRPDIIDPALLRPGRFDRVIEVPQPDPKAREEILVIHARGRPLAQDVSLSKIAEETDGFSGAQLEAVAEEASLLAIQDYLDTGGNPADQGKVGKTRIEAKHFDLAVNRIKKEAAHAPTRYGAQVSYS